MFDFNIWQCVTELHSSHLTVVQRLFAITSYATLLSALVNVETNCHYYCNLSDALSSSSCISFSPAQLVGLFCHVSMFSIPFFQA